MRTKGTILVVLMLSMLLAGIVSAGAPIHQVSGGGRFVLEDGSFETYGFVVQVDAAGVVSGQGEFHIHDGLSAHFEANCLAVEGGTSWIGGVVTRSDDPSFAPVGLEFTWQLQDNGEGANADPDLQSFLLPNYLLPVFGLGNDCHDKGPLFALGIFEWQDGNIQVR